MPFIGTTPTQGFVSSFPKQSFTPNGSTTVFTLTNPVATANDLEVFVGNVRQEPTTAYTAAGTTLTMSEAPATGLNFYVINKSFAQVTTTPPVNSISADKIIANAVTTAKIADNNVTVAKLPTTIDLSSNTVTLNKNASALVHITAINVTPNATTYELNMDYDDHNDFLIIINNIKGSSGSGNENLDLKFKMDGVLDNGEGAPYFTTGSVEFGSVRNLNSADNMELFTTNLPSKHTSGFLHCTNFRGLSEGHPMIQFALGGASNSNNNYGHYTGSCGMEVHPAASNKQVTAMRFAYTAGNVTEVDLEIYGYKR